MTLCYVILYYIILYLEDPADTAGKPLVVWVRRGAQKAADANSRARQEVDFSVVLLQELKKNLDVSVLGKDFSGAPQALKDLLSLLRRADALAGLHGAGLMHVLYMRPGTVLLELKTSFGFEKELFAEAARQRGIAYYATNVRGFAEKDGVRVPPTAAARLSRGLREAVLRQRAEAGSAAEGPCAPVSWEPWCAALPSDGGLGRWPRCGALSAADGLELRLRREVALALPARGK